MNSITSKILLITLVFFILGTAMALPAAAQDQDLGQVQTQEQKQPRFRVGVYFEGYMINDKNLKSFYHHSQRNLLGFEASIHTVYNIDVWASYRTYYDEAKTTFYEKTDKLQINAVSVGLQYRPIRWKFLEPFVGAGLDLYSYKETIEEGSDVAGASGNATGFYVQTGTYVDIYKFIALTAFYRYNIVKKTLANPLPDGSTSLDLGGHEFGVGIVVRF
jgi:opacity protein-like surface antigen